MSGFRAVNTTLTVQDVPGAKLGEETTPTTPRPNKFFQSEHAPDDSRRLDESSVKTPTRDSFNGLVDQRPLPSVPFTPPHEATPSEPGSAPAGKEYSSESSHRSTQSLDSNVDMDMEDDNDTQNPGSDNESATSESRPTKKKKGQRFFCTEFPPCQLSFTRSEHLARHIRKHTGERPFQCHCSRRFSRLDNLRQHAQTVHVNEDIPGDSLAATGTRFQRQIRTDRVRPPTNRSRASTLGSSGSHSRGHSRNLSTSSIASNASSFSTMSQMSQDDFRNRPAQLAMASTPSADPSARARLTVDTFNPQLMGSPGPTLYSQPDTRGHGGYTTPPSATYSPATGSPRFSSALQSPTSAAHSRHPFGGPTSTHARRLSVPSSGANPFQPHPGAGAHPQQAYITPMASTSGSAHGSVYGSPTSSIFSGVDSRRESAAEADWRRRTWHPSTYTGIGQRPATSGLSYYQTPDSPPIAHTSAPQQQGVRLPGIESFDHAPPVPNLPRRIGSPMQVDSPQHAQGDLQSGIKRLEIANAESRSEQARPHSGHYGQAQQQSQGQQLPSLREAASGAPAPQPQGLFNTAFPHPPSHNSMPPAAQQTPLAQQQPQPPPSTLRHSDQPTTPKRAKRLGWINGPLPGSQIAPQLSNQPVFSQYVNYSSVQNPPPAPPPQPQPAQAPHPPPANPAFTNLRTSPEDSSSSDGIPTPASSNVGEWNPAIVRHDGNVDARHAPQPAVAVDDGKFRQQQQQPQQTPRSDISSWSLQHAQMESRKREREGEGRRGAAMRDSGVDVGQPELGVVGRGDMRRLEALVAVATGEQRA